MNRVAVLALVALFGFCGCRQSPSSSESSETAGASGGVVNGAQGKTLVEGGATLLDVRTPGEFAGGHPEAAINIPVQELAARMAEVPQGAEVVVYCQSGVRSATAARMLREAGYVAHDMGSVGAWPN